MTLRTLGRRAAGALLALGLAAGAAAEPAEGSGWIRAVDAAGGEIRLLDGTRLTLSAATEIRDAAGAPLGLAELAERGEESGRVWYAGERSRTGVALDRLVVGVEVPR